MPHNVTAMPFVLQSDYISVVVNGKAERVTKGQPTFKQLYAALEKGQWAKVPKLVSLAAQIADKSHGKVTVNANGVFYKGQKVDNSITAKINELIRHSKPVAHVLRFMDNLYQQPDMNTVNEVYEWLSNGRFALTDDGCFYAYKYVDANYKDCYTHTIDNSPGQIVTMPRTEVDPDRRNECSRGLHFCSKAYLRGYSSNHIMLVKVHPADVVAIPKDYGYTKGRTWRYEVIREVQAGEMVVGETDAPLMMQPVIEIAKERLDLIKQVKSLPTVKRLMRRGKLTSASFSKASVARLTEWLKKFSRMDIAPAKSKLFDNPLRFAREAAGFTLGQVVKATDSKLTLQDAYNAERSQRPEQKVIDMVLKAIAKLQGNTVRQSGISYPKPTVKKAAAPAYAYSSYYSTPSGASATAVLDEDEDEEDDDEDYD